MTDERGRLEGALTPLDQIELEVFKIEVPERLRGLDVAHAENLARSMDDLGLTHPISVRLVDEPGRQRWVLLAGLHRLHAARLLRWPTIRANAYRCTDDAARLVEIDENLARREMSYWHRAVFLAERQALYERLYPETRQGVAGALARHRQSQSGRVSFAEDVAERVGLTPRSIRQAVGLVRQLEPEVRAWADQDPALQNDAQALRLLARRPAARQRGLAAARDLGVLRSVPAAAGAEAQFKALCHAWVRAGRPAQERFRAWLDSGAGDA